MKAGDKVRLGPKQQCVTAGWEGGEGKLIGPSGGPFDACRKRAPCWNVGDDKDFSTCIPESALTVIPEAHVFKVEEWAERVVQAGHPCLGCVGQVTGLLGAGAVRRVPYPLWDCGSLGLGCWSPTGQLKPCPSPTGNHNARMVMDDLVKHKPPQSGIERTDAMQWFEIGAHEEKTEAEGTEEAKEARIVVARTDILARNEETAKLILIRRVDAKANLEKVVLHIRPFPPVVV